MTVASALERMRESIRGLSERDRRALRLGGMIALPVGLWLMVVQPYVRTVESLNDRLASEQGLLDRERALLASAPRMGGLLKTTGAKLREWDARLVRAPNTAFAETEVTTVLEVSARRNRVLLQEVASTAPPPGTPSPAGLHPVRMTVRGESDFEGVLGFLGALEQHEIVFHVVGVSLDRIAASGRDQPGAESQPGAVSFIAIVEAFARLDG